MALATGDSGLKRLGRHLRIQHSSSVVGLSCPRLEGLAKSPVSTWPHGAMESLNVSVAMARRFTRRLG